MVAVPSTVKVPIAKLSKELLFVTALAAMSKVPIAVLPVNIPLVAVAPGPMFTVVIVVAILSNALLALT